MWLVYDLSCNLQFIIVYWIHSSLERWKIFEKICSLLLLVPTLSCPLPPIHISHSQIYWGSPWGGMPGFNTSNNAHEKLYSPILSSLSINQIPSDPKISLKIVFQGRIPPKQLYKRPMSLNRNITLSVSHAASVWVESGQKTKQSWAKLR